MTDQSGIIQGVYIKMNHDKNKCPECGSFKFGYHKIRRGDPTLTDDVFDLWICINCNYQPFDNVRGLI